LTKSLFHEFATMHQFDWKFESSSNANGKDFVLVHMLRCAHLGSVLDCQYRYWSHWHQRPQIFITSSRFHLLYCGSHLLPQSVSELAASMFHSCSAVTNRRYSSHVSVFSALCSE
jgi:hypothetical protein